jgi:hypothetical protein
VDGHLRPPKLSDRWKNTHIPSTGPIGVVDSDLGEIPVVHTAYYYYDKGFK